MTNVAAYVNPYILLTLMKFGLATHIFSAHTNRILFLVIKISNDSEILHSYRIRTNFRGTYFFAD